MVRVCLSFAAVSRVVSLAVSNSTLLKGSSFLERHRQGSGGEDSDALFSIDGQLFRDYLKQQVDHLMTGDAGRDGVAEGRRGTHVEVSSDTPSLSLSPA